MLLFVGMRRPLAQSTMPLCMYNVVCYKTKRAAKLNHFAALCRDEATRTPDPYVPNVVRYQLRYIPITFRLVLKSECKGTSFF